MTKSIQTSMGILIADIGARGVRRLYCAGQKYAPINEEHSDEEGLGGTAECEIFSRLQAWLNDYFEGNAPAVDFPLDLSGTPFQLGIYRYLAAIPYGKTVSYQEVAAAKNTSPRAAAGAIARNPILILIPCHRVIGKNGSLTGFAAGLDLKEKLLKLESV